jgi:hypothetical protein
MEKGMNPNAWDWKAVPAELESKLESRRQIETFRLLREGKAYRQIAVERSIAQRNVETMVGRIKTVLLAAGFDPRNGMTLVSPDPQTLKGRSALVKVNEDGSETVAMYWNKTNTTKEQMLEAIRKGIQEAAESFKPLGKVKAPKYTMTDLCTVYTLTDYHLGAYSWKAETGADWDVRIAKEVMLKAFNDMLYSSPESETAIFAQLGDFLHFDGLLALTPTSKHVLDADTRFPLIVQTAIELCVGVVEMLLHKHANVHVLMAEGNHDMASSVWLRAIMALAFKNNERVTVDASPAPFYSFKWGETFLGWHHGHLQKMDNLPLLFATDPRFRSDYGQCKHTYIHTGHMHHQKVIDKGGIVVEQHPTLAARDAHGARGFLLSNRETKAITYHKQHGEVSRCTVRPSTEAAA